MQNYVFVQNTKHMIRALLQTHTLQQKLTLCLLASAVILFGAYVYFVNTTVHHVVERKALDSTAGEQATRVSELEFDYMALKNSITLETAYAAGFQESPRTHFIAKVQAPPSLTLNR